MLNGLKITFRNLQRNRLYAYINIIGLAVSLTAVILILLWVQDELGFDRFHKRAKDIYVVVSHTITDGVEDYHYFTVPPLSRVAQERIAGVEAACAVRNYWGMGYLEYNREKIFGGQYLLADTGIFQVFDATFLEGSPQHAFIDPYSVVITDVLAKKFFGDEPAFGKPIKSSLGETYTISAVVKQMPKNSSLQFDAVFSMEPIKGKDNWGHWAYQNYFLIRPGTDLTLLGEQLMEMNPYYGEFNDNFRPYLFQHIYNYRLYNADGTESGMKSVRLFSFIVLIILIIACINYVNLVTARAEKRRKEMSMRKLLGGRRGQLFRQVMGEALTLFVIAILLATVFVYLLNPLYNDLAGKQLAFTVFSRQTLLVYLITFALVCILAGIYPSVFLTSFRPKEALSALPRGKKNFFSFRKLLVVSQFICSVVFIFGTIVLNRQLHYMRTKDPGYDKEQVFFMDILSNRTMAKHYESFKSDLQQHSAVLGVSASEQHIMETGNYTSDLSWEGMEEGRDVNIMYYGVAPDLLPMFKIPLVEGEGFLGTPADSARYMLNESAVRKLGIENPVGKWFEFWDTRGIITGVVKDFNTQHMSTGIQPMVIINWPSGYWNIYVKAAPGKLAEAIAETEKAWHKFDPETPFSYMLMDAKFDEMYKADIRTGNLFNVFAIITILISCLGLFGLVTFTAETKTKEVGIRKVLGATIGNVVNMLSREFLILVGIAMLIAFPLAYYWMNNMLQGYAYRITISWWMFAVAALITIILTVLTVGWQALKSATANPVKSIKTE